MPKFNKIVLSNITPGKIDSWLLKLDVSDGTRDHIRTTLRIIFRETMREHYLQSNPMKYVELSKIIRKSNEPPMMHELRKIFPADKADFFKIWPTIHYGVMCAVMASSGLRVQELRAMTPKCIVKEKQGIIVVQAVNTNGEIVLPKKDEIRIVIVPKETIDLLSWWITDGLF